jgi:flagellar biosynthesis/type III secretory pathway protein FliH
LKLDPARSALIGVFIESYLKLTARELRKFDIELGRQEPQERKAAMELLTSWHRTGRQEGLQEGLHLGKEDLVMRQIRRRFGSVSSTVTQRLDTLTSDQLNELGEALLDFTSPSDLDNWLSRS